MVFDDENDGTQRVYGSVRISHAPASLGSGMRYQWRMEYQSETFVASGDVGPSG